ncbi:MAG: hypothetical protein ACTJGD_02435 [Mesonia hippocampi]|uniref:hypothetical protein n=1 Tax=Mesonia hippocampi TaxID=1628250 RepID=UPI003F9676C3
MKAKAIIALAGILFSSATVSLSAQEVDCRTTLSLFVQSAKIKDYKAAEPHYKTLMQGCEDYSLATYQYGERMYKSLLKSADASSKKIYAAALIANYEDRLANFPGKTKKGEVYADIAQAMYDNGIGTKEEQYAAFDKAWNLDQASFNSPKALYTYFNLVVDLQDAGKKELKDVFEKYDELIKKIETQEIMRAEQAAPLIQKQEEGVALDAKETRTLKNSEIYLTNFSKIKAGINGLLGQRADCENLVPLYNKDFEAKQNDVDWLKRAARRLSAKECEDPIFFKLVEALHRAEPSVKTAYYLGQLADRDGNSSKALAYYNESAELQTDPVEKASVYMKIANNYRKKNSYSSARSYYRKALKLQPSLGVAYLHIGNMYASSANNCGETVFNKRAVYWLAAEYADRAGRVDPSIKSTAAKTAASYRQRAPQKSDIFTGGVQPGSSIKIGCWIGESVRVPNL